MTSTIPGGQQENAHQEPVRISFDLTTLLGDLQVPSGARGLVLFAHGSGSSRFSPRNRSVAQALRRERLGTLLVDLLTSQEEQTDVRTGQFRFNIALLAQRLIGITDWLARSSATKPLRIGCFGASTGAAAALITAAERPNEIYAVVSRGGRPDLAGTSLRQVRAPTLFIVGGEDFPVIDLNREAFDQLSTEKSMNIIPGATHLFEEPGALEEVSRLAGQWFVRYLTSSIGPSLK
jgi:putative phosphoribosyl transferase